MKSSNRKKLLILPVALLVLLLGVLGVQATIDCNLTVPASSGVVSKRTELNATFNTTLDGTTQNVSVAFQVQAVSSIISADGYTTANSSYVLIANVTNTTSLRYTNLTFGDQYIFGDGSYNFRAICYLNATGTGGPVDPQTTSSVVTATIDRSAPICSFDSKLVGGKTYAPNQKWSVTCKNASSATIQFGSNNPLSMSKTVDTCTFTGDKNKVPEHSYPKLTAAISDGYNITNCILNNIRIDLGAPLKEVAVIVASQGGGKAVASQTTGTTGRNNNNLILIVIIGLAVWWYVRRKKGK